MCAELYVLNGLMFLKTNHTKQKGGKKLHDLDVFYTHITTKWQPIK